MPRLRPILRLTNGVRLHWKVLQWSLTPLLLAVPVQAQSWRDAARGVGNTARVLLIGTHPEDEDNALIAWLSLGRNVETAYLSLTRGEGGANVAGNERQSALAVVRTAELLAERQRDGAHQYFTRAYDFGFARSDSVVDARWPRDSLLGDAVAVIRAFRPQVVIVLLDSSDRNPTHRVVARLAREAIVAAADTLRIPRATTGRLAPWTVSRLFTRVDSATAVAVAIDVGELDRATGRSYAELGADIRRLQRTQPALPAPPIGHLWRYLRLDNQQSGERITELFDARDTSWSRFRAALPDSGARQLDSLHVTLGEIAGLALSATGDELSAPLARLIARANDLRRSLSCVDVVGVPLCPGVAGDLAATLETVRERATRALLGAAGIVIDATVAREVVAKGDLVPVTVAVRNGSGSPIVVRSLEATSGNAWTPIVREASVPIPADSVMQWSSTVRVIGETLHWWQTHGLAAGLWLHDFAGSRSPQLIGGEDRINMSRVDGTIAIAGFDIPVRQQPLVYRDPGAVRGDVRHPLAGATPTSILFEKIAEYERAGLPIDRLVRVYLTSAHDKADTVSVSLQTPAGVKPDSVTRVGVIPPHASLSVFFRIRGTMKPGMDSLSAIAAPVSTAPVPVSASPRELRVSVYTYGSVAREYPHIPTQQFIRLAHTRLEAVDLRVPPRLRVAYVKGTDDVVTPLGQLQVNLQTIEPSLLPVIDLSGFTTVLIGADAMTNDALAGAIPALKVFMRNGGAVVVLPGGDDLPRSGLFPYPFAFDTATIRMTDADAPVSATDPKAQVLTWPNVITAADFADWTGSRARNVPATFDPRYRTALSVAEPEQPPTMATILYAPVGKGVIVYCPLSLDRQLAATNPGAARLFVNLLSTGLRPGARPK